ncbi:hypothetical protein LINPERHAP2_LOCUS31787 [Linum perenne]
MLSRHMVLELKKKRLKKKTKSAASFSLFSSLPKKLQPAATSGHRLYFLPPSPPTGQRTAARPNHDQTSPAGTHQMSADNRACNNAILQLLLPHPDFQSLARLPSISWVSVDHQDGRIKKGILLPYLARARELPRFQEEDRA